MIPEAAVIKLITFRKQILCWFCAVKKFKKIALPNNFFKTKIKS